jgi:hypothetical protein
MASSSALKRKLSSSAAGNTGIEIAATSTAGDAIHTAVAGTTAGTYDEIWLWAQNNHSADVLLTVEFSGADHAQNIKMTIPFQRGPFLVIPGFILQNAATVKAFAATTAVITVHGFINAITD